MKNNTKSPTFARGFLAALVVASIASLAILGPSAVANCTGGECEVLTAPSRLEAEDFETLVSCVDGLEVGGRGSEGSTEYAFMPIAGCRLEFGPKSIENTPLAVRLRAKVTGTTAPAELDVRVMTDGVYTHSHASISQVAGDPWQIVTVYPAAPLPDGPHTVTVTFDLVSGFFATNLYLDYVDFE